MELYTEDIQAIIDYFPRVIAAVLVLLIFYLLGKYLARILVSVVSRITANQVHEVFFRTIIGFIGIYIGLIIALNILGLERLALSLLAGGGVTAIVLGFAFREIGENFLAGIFLAFSRPFKIGDLIKTEDVTGHVKKIELRYTHIRASNGSDVFVPSSQLFGKTLINYTIDGYRRMEFTIGIDYADEALKACDLLATCFTDIPGVLAEPKANARINAFEQEFVQLQVFFWVDYFNKEPGNLNIQSKVMDRCRKTLLENNFTLSSETTANIAISKSEK